MFFSYTILTLLARVITEKVSFYAFPSLCISFYGNSFGVETQAYCEQLCTGSRTHFNGPRNVVSLRWRHNERDGVSSHQPHDCLLKRLFRRRSKETSKFRVTGLCVGNSSVTGEFPTQRASSAQNAPIWWRHLVDRTSAESGPLWRFHWEFIFDFILLLLFYFTTLLQLCGLFLFYFSPTSWPRAFRAPRTLSCITWLYSLYSAVPSLASKYMWSVMPVVFGFLWVCRAWLKKFVGKGQPGYLFLNSWVIRSYVHAQGAINFYLVRRTISLVIIENFNKFPLKRKLSSGSMIWYFG